MTARLVAVAASDLVVWALLAIGVGIALLCCIGVVAFRSPYDRLHFTGPAAVIAPLPIAIAVLVEQGPVQMGAAKSVLVAVLLMITGPLAGHAIARTLRLREAAEEKASLDAKGRPER